MKKWKHGDGSRASFFYIREAAEPSPCLPKLNDHLNMADKNPKLN
jgi:hypothetical protein